jgi:hypothetical protein
MTTSNTDSEGIPAQAEGWRLAIPGRQGVGILAGSRRLDTGGEIGPLYWTSYPSLATFSRKCWGLDIFLGSGNFGVLR